MINNCAVLVELNIGVWTARKMDKKVSAEVDNANNTTTRAGNYHKNLMAGTAALDKVNNLAAGLRNWHYSQTLPWTDNGQRLLPMSNFFAYKTKLAEKRSELEVALDEFYAQYATLVTAMAFKLGSLFNPQEYPSLDIIKTKNYFNVVFSPVPDSGDFRVDIPQEYIEELNAVSKKREETAMLDVWNRFHTVLSHLSDKLAGETKQIFRDSLIENVTEMCALLTKLNVTNDTNLEHARQEVEKALIGIEPSDLRKSDTLRLDTKARVDHILSLF